MTVAGLLKHHLGHSVQAVRLDPLGRTHEDGTGGNVRGRGAHHAAQTMRGHGDDDVARMGQGVVEREHGTDTV